MKLDSAPDQSKILSKQSEMSNSHPIFCSIQALRGIAALAVVLCHLRNVENRYLSGEAIIPFKFEYGQIGVDLFFVISGFVLTIAAENRFGKPKDAVVFFVRRTIRIYPVYWFWFSVVLMVYIVRPDMVNSNHGNPNLLSSFLLLPDENIPLVMVAWTLSYEVFFYICFAIIIFFCKARWLTIIMAIWGMSVAFGSLYIVDERSSPLVKMIFNPYILEFLAGCIVAMLFKHVGGHVGVAMVVVGFGGLAAVPLSLGDTGFGLSDGWERVPVFGTLCAIFLCGCVAVERHWKPRFPAFVMAIGGSSYSLYLSHVMTTSAVGRGAKWLLEPSSVATHILMIGTAVAAAQLVGWLAYRYLEQPLLKYCNLKSMGWIEAIFARRSVQPRNAM